MTEAKAEQLAERLDKLDKTKFVFDDVQPWPSEPPWLGWSKVRQEIGRCSGHCCRAFTIPIQPETMEKMRIAVENQEKGEPWPNGLWKPNDIHIVATMVRPFGPFHILTPAGDKFRFDSPQAWYSCKHHDAESGDCRIYDERPEMCREHPYGEECNYVDCTMQQVVFGYEWVGPPNVHEPVSKYRPGDLVKMNSESESLA